MQLDDAVILGSVRQDRMGLRAARERFLIEFDGDARALKRERDTSGTPG